MVKAGQMYIFYNLKCCSEWLNHKKECGTAQQGAPQLSSVVNSWIRIRIRIEVKMQKEAQNGAMKGRRRSQLRRRGSKWSRGGSSDQWSHFPITFLRNRIRIRIRICIKVKSRIRIRINMKRGIRIKVMRIGNTRYWFISLWVPVWHAETMNVKNLRTITGTVITFYCQKWTRRGCVSSCFVCVLLGQQQSAVCSQLEEDNHSIWRRNWGKFLHFLLSYNCIADSHFTGFFSVEKPTFYVGKIR